MERKELDQMFRIYYSEALLYSVALTHHSQDAEDIVQHAFLKAMETAEGSIRDFKPWLFRVCRNEWLQMLRKRKREDGDAEKALEQAADDAPLPEAELIREEEYRALYRELMALSPEKREVLELFYFSECSIREIAKIVGRTEGSVKTMLSRARAELRERLEERL